MKRRLIALFMLILLVSSFLSASIGIYETDRSHSFEPFSLMSPRVIGMGGAGMALDGTMESRLMNPANSPGLLGLSLPYASVSVYNMKNNMDNLIDIYKENDRLGLYDIAFSLLNSVPGGERNFISVDLGAGLSLRNISLFGFMNADVFTFGEGDLSSNIGLDIDFGYITTLSYAYDWDEGYSLSVGLGFSALFKNITAGQENLSGIGINTVSHIFEEFQNNPKSLSEALFNAFNDSVPISVGEAYPVSLGLRAEFPYGFSLALALNNMNGNFSMKGLDLTGSYTGEDYIIETPLSLDFGFGWHLDAGKLWYHLIEPTVAFDIVDIIGLFQQGIFNKGVLVDHLKMGAEINFLTLFNARCGLDRGYFTFGAGFDFYALVVDLSYGVRPYGPSREGRYLDYVKLRINLGYDRP